MHDSGSKSAISAVVTCHDCKKTGHKNKDCNRLTKRSDMAKSGNLKNSRNKWHTYHRSNDHPNEDCYQQQSETKSLNLDSDRKIWCNNSGSISDGKYRTRKKTVKVKT